MSHNADHFGTVHVVAAPTTLAAVPHDIGRLAPPLLLAEAIRHGRVPAGRVVVIGPTGATETARACGLTPGGRLTLPVGRPALGRQAFRRIAGGVQRVMCWSDELAPMVGRIADETHLISTDPARCTAPARRFTRISVLNEADARIWRERGATPVIEPDWLGDPPADGEITRPDLGVEPSVLTLAALDDRPSQTDARGLAFLLSVLHTTGYAVCGVVPSMSFNASAARRHLRGLTSRYRLLLTELPLVSLLGSIDIVVTSDEVSTGASEILESAARSRGARVIRLSHKGRAGLKSTPGAVAPILETLDAILAERRNSPQAEPEAAHA